MMTETEQLKLQAFLDGELPQKEASDVAAWVARDREASDLLKELRNTRQALGGFEPPWKVPESREFYWSKIQREILRNLPAQPVSQPGGLSVWLRRLVVPASALAVLTIAATIGGLQFGLFGPAPAPDTEMTDIDSGTFTYHDYANGTTLVWLSYPPER